MSLAEDNFDDLLETYNPFEELEEIWQKGKHKDKNGNIYKIKEMTDNHLINTIKFFKGGADTTLLKKEAKNRKLKL